MIILNMSETFFSTLIQAIFQRLERFCLTAHVSKRFEFENAEKRNQVTRLHEVISK
jgi:hypothetical protein